MDNASGPILVGAVILFFGLVSLIGFFDSIKRGVRTFFVDRQRKKELPYERLEIQKKEYMLHLREVELQQKAYDLQLKEFQLRQKGYRLREETSRSIDRKRIHQRVPRIFTGIAMYRMAEKLSHEETPDKGEILHLLQGAAETGYEEAMNALGNFYSYKTFASGLEKSHETNLIKARSWYEKGARRGSLKAMENLAQFLKNGLGGSVDKKRAIELRKKIAQATNESISASRTDQDLALNEQEYDLSGEWVIPPELATELSADLSCLDALGEDLLGTVEDLDKPIYTHLQELELSANFKNEKKESENGR